MWPTPEYRESREPQVPTSGSDRLWTWTRQLVLLPQVLQVHIVELDDPFFASDRELSSQLLVFKPVYFTPIRSFAYDVEQELDHEHLNGIGDMPLLW